EQKVYIPKIIFGEKMVMETASKDEGVSAALNDSKLKLNNLKDYIQMYLKSIPGLTGRISPGGLCLNSQRVVGGQLHPLKPGSNSAASFINSISAPKGGTHINYVPDAIVKLIQEARISGISKLEDTNKAGTQESDECTLILSEGDSAMALVMGSQTKVGKLMN
ncbi:DNA topoisomerase 2, partial [Massospora cicadina]